MWPKIIKWRRNVLFIFFCHDFDEKGISVVWRLQCMETLSALLPLQAWRLCSYQYIVIYGCPICKWVAGLDVEAGCPGYRPRVFRAGDMPCHHYYNLITEGYGSPRPLSGELIVDVMTFFIVFLGHGISNHICHFKWDIMTHPCLTLFKLSRRWS